MNMQKQSTSKKRRQLFNILTGQTLYQKPIIDENIFNVDLVLKMKFPLDQSEMMIQKSKHVPLDEFVYNPDKRLIEAHQEAYQRLISSSPMIQEVSNKKQQNNIQIQNQVNFKSVQQNQPIVDKQYQGILGNGRKRKIVFPCYVKCTSNQVDCFTLNFNTLMYVLQKKCGFQTKSYLVVEETLKNSDKKQAYIYILINQSIPNLLKAADRFQIKKQIDYPQIDLFLNEPVDSLSRPYQNNSCISKPELQEKVLNKIKTQKQQLKKKLALSKQSQPIPQIYLKKQQQKERKMKRKDRKTTSQQLNNQQKQKQAYFKKQNQIKQLFKRVHRNMNDKVYKLSELIVEQKQISQKQQHKISNYLAEFFLQFDKIMQTQIQLTPQQKSYICALNNGKINPKCEKEYIIKLKRKKVFYLIKDLSQKYGHTTYDHPITYFPFILPSRRLGFMERFRNMLLYEEYIVSPYGDLSPFSKMDRIKIAYLNLKDHIRVQNLNKIGCFVFAIHNDYERYGITGQPLSERKLKQNIKGGINGTNLFDCWNPLTPWTADIQTIRNYFGEDTAYQVYLKTHLILYFIVIAPLGIVGQVVSRLFIYYNAHYTQYMDRGFSSTHKQQLLFHILFFALTIGIFAYFLERWMHKEEDFQETFVQNETRSTFRYHYQGPFIRNNVTDSVNEHKLTLDTKSIVIKSIGFLLILIILGGQCGFFHGMRMAIIQFTKVIPQTNVYLISWSHIICYGIFFIANYFIYNWIIVNFSSFWTKLQNIPTEDLHRDSIRSKNSLFLIGIQLIPVIFLLIFQPFKSTSCYSQSCYDEFTQYIYSRYVIVFIFLGLKLLSFVYLYIQASIKWKSQKNNSQIITFDEKLLNFINFIEAQSTRPEFESTIIDQTEALLHYGMFLTSFPLSPLLGLANMILEYLIERIQLIVRNKRPIPKSQALQLYSGNYKIIMHLSIFVNCWLIFFTLEQVEYSFGRLIRIFASQNPTYEGILVLKIAIIIISIVIFQIYVQIIRFFVSEGSHKMLNNRKKRKYEKHILYKNVIQKNKPTLEVNKIYPFRTIFRTYHKELILRSRKGQNSLTEVSQGTEQQFSAQYLKAKKG